MSSQNQALLALSGVKAFRGHNVTGGVLHMRDDEFVSHLDATYGEAIVCNINVKPGRPLQVLFPDIFMQIKADHVQGLQEELQNQLANGNDVDIDFH